MKHNKERLLYGGIALIVVGVIILVGNIDSYPLSIILTIIGIILVGYSTKEDATEDVSFTLLINNCKLIIEKYETPLHFNETSCASLLIEEITKLKNASKTEVKLDIDKIDKHAHFILLNRCYALLSSGEYHIFRGELNPIGVAFPLKKVYEGCVKWLLDNGYLSQEEYDEHRHQLSENISLIG